MIILPHVQEVHIFVEDVDLFNIYIFHLFVYYVIGYVTILQFHVYITLYQHLLLEMLR